MLVEPVESRLSGGVLRWIPSAATDDDIVMRTGYGDDSRNYTCRAVDDGYFALPEDVATASDGTRTFAGVYRERTDIIVEQRVGWFARRTHGVFLFD